MIDLNARFTAGAELESAGEFTITLFLGVLIRLNHGGNWTAF